MRIAIFTETYLPDVNGVATHIKTLCDGLEALGHEVLVIASDAAARRHYISKNVLHCPAFTSKRLYKYSISYPISIRRFEMIRKWNPDIIHIQNEFGMGLSGIQIAKILKKPLVYTLHTMYDDYIYYVAHKPFIPMVTKLSHLYFRGIANRSDAVTGASEKIEGYLRECGVRKTINIIPNAVELDIFSYENADREKIAKIRERYSLDGKTAFCFCGRLGTEKSVDVLLKYWAETVRPEDGMQLMIFGDGPAREELTALCRELHAEETVCFTGKIPHNELPEYYCACDAYLTASLSENYSISTLEAMASGLFVIHRLDAVNESQYLNGINGKPFETAEEMYREMRRIRDLDDDSKAKLKAAVADTVKNSGTKDLAKYLIDIYFHIYDSNSKENKRKAKFFKLR